MATKNATTRGRDNRSRSRNRDNNNNRSGKSRGFQRQKMPRAPQKQSFWQKFLAFFGIGSSKPSKSRNSRPLANSALGKTGRIQQNRNSRSERPGAGRERRPVEQVEVTSERLYVGNLSYDATEEDLQELFAGVGTVRSAEIVSNRRTQRSKGYAFVIMGSIDEARRAVEVLHDQDYMDRKLVVSGAKSEGPEGEGDDA